MEPSIRTGGKAALASGILGIFTIVALIIGIVVRNAHGLAGAAFTLFRVHDLTGILQFLFLLPVSIALYRLSQQGAKKMSRRMLNTAIIALSLTALLLILNFPKLVGEPLYMFTQGIFGAWVIMACLRLGGLFRPGLRWFGIFAGAGLLLVGLFPLGYALFVDTVILQIPAAPDEVIQKIPAGPANNVLHYILFTGTFMGVFPFPFWTILVGQRLLLPIKM